MKTEPEAEMNAEVNVTQPVVVRDTLMAGFT